MTPGGSPVDEAQWRRLESEWFPQLVDHRLRQVSWPSIEPHRDYVAAQLAAGVTVHQRLRDEHGLDASVASVRRWVAANLPEQARRAQVTVLHDAPPPGEQAQIDYGRLGMWLDPTSGRGRTVWAFVMVLPCSRHLFVRPTRACRPLDGAAPVAAFAAVEAAALRPLPTAPFVLATWSSARVGPDIHAKVGACLYSLPWLFFGDRVDARSTPSMVQFFHHGQLIKTHPRKDRGRQTDLGDYPPEKIAFHTQRSDPDFTANPKLPDQPGDGSVRICAIHQLTPPSAGCHETCAHQATC